MKKIFWLLIFVFVFSLIPQVSFAQPKKAVDYELPYPGLLPDSPLYFLKMIRDRLVWFLISDPLKKADFNLLTADKRLNGALYLFREDKNKIKLVESTISKGENYFEEAIKKVKEAKKQGMDTADILRRLETSSQKHQEILEKMGFASLRKRTENFEKEVKSLRQ